MSVARTLGSVLPASMMRTLPLTMPFAPTGETASRFATQARPAAKNPQMRVLETLNNGVIGRLATWEGQLLALQISDYGDPKAGGKVLQDTLNTCRDTKGLTAARRLYADFRLYNRVARATSSGGYTPASRAHEADRWLRMQDPNVIATFDAGLATDLSWIREGRMTLSKLDAIDSQQRNVLAILAAVFPAPDVITASGEKPYWHRSTVKVNYDRSYDIIVQDQLMYDRVMADIDYFGAVPGLRNVEMSTTSTSKRDLVLSPIICEALSAKAPGFELSELVSLGAYCAVLKAPEGTTPERAAEVLTFIRDLLRANGETQVDARLARY